MADDPPRVLVVEGRFYADIQDEMRRGAAQALEVAGAPFDVIVVPGAFEIPGAIAFAEEAGHRPAGTRYDGYVALGCVIRGETSHYDYVCGESARGLMDLAIGKRLAIGYGVLTCENDDQAWERARVTSGNKGGAAAQACLEMIALKRRLSGGAR
ncbi:MAG TPA: 6,7-dimethyl-8-ribityllumazine synthase [Caulobacteraceae bacterium]|jgi:6,7-dimethyl-8-ribityllumazine synthase